MRHSLLAAAKYRPTLTKTEKSNRTNQVSWRTHERIAPLTRSSPCEDYRARGEVPGNAWIKPMTLAAGEFIRRFLLHVLPSGFHRIRHYGFLASPGRAATIERLRDMIAASDVTARPRPDATGRATTAHEPA